MSYEISVTRVDATPVAVVKEIVPRDAVAEFIGRAFSAVMSEVDYGALAGPPIARYDFVGDDFSIEAGFPVPPGTTVSGDVQLIELPAGDVAQTMHVGPYEDVVEAYHAMESWFVSNGYRPNGAPWESYLDEPGVEKPRTLVTWPCARV